MKLWLLLPVRWSRKFGGPGRKPLSYSSREECNCVKFNYTFCYWRPFKIRTVHKLTAADTPVNIGRFLLSTVNEYMWHYSTAISEIDWNQRLHSLNIPAPEPWPSWWSDSTPWSPVINPTPPKKIVPRVRRWLLPYVSFFDTTPRDEIIGY
jgi:hypothetical protein